VGWVATTVETQHSFNSKFKIQNSKFKIQNSKFKIQNSKFKIQNEQQYGSVSRWSQIKERKSL